MSKILSAEEILKSKLPQIFQNGWFGSNPTIDWEHCLEAMQEHTKHNIEALREKLKEEIEIITIDSDGNDTCDIDYDSIDQTINQFLENIK